MSETTDQISELLCWGRLEEAQFEWIEAQSLPEPYRGLLSHERDMTSTLSNFYGGQVELSVLGSEKIGENYRREVLLSVAGRAVEYGVILVSLASFPKALQEQILEEKMPLGAILNSAGHPYVSAPRGFLKFSMSDWTSEIFASASSASLYGRYNTLANLDGSILASILEILPSAEQ